MSNGLTPAQVERLVKLQEELNEAGKEVCKILLHGYHATAPNGVTYDNQVALEKELGDVRSAVRLLVDRGDLDESTIRAASADKDRCITMYMHHQESADELAKEVRWAWELLCSETAGGAHQYDYWEDVPQNVKDSYLKRARVLARVCKGKQNA